MFESVSSIFGLAGMLYFLIPFKAQLNTFLAYLLSYATSLDFRFYLQYFHL